MDGKSMTRKDFITLTFTLIGSAAMAGRCSNDNDNSGTGTGGTTAQSGGTSGTGHGGTGGHGGTAGTGGSGGSTTGACTDPLPESQLPDQTGHVHMVVVPASTLSATSDQSFTTTAAGAPAHMHAVVLTTADLATLKGGGTVTVTSGPASGHMHQFAVTCT